MSFATWRPRRAGEKIHIRLKTKQNKEKQSLAKLEDTTKVENFSYLARCSTEASQGLS